jgi:regulator of RNase E activity RraB
MMPDYPDDADGDALRRVAADGNDMSAPMVVDFPVVLPAPTPAKHFAAVAAARGYQVQMWKHDDDSGWDVICSISMVALHADVVRIQQELTELARPYRGFCDSWGTGGNKPGG